MKELRPCDWELIEQVLDGRSNAEIASAWVLSEKAIEKHMSSLLAKLGVRSRREMVAFLLKHHLTWR